MEISGRTVVITGAGSGLGRATAVRLARRGARVSLLDFDEASISALANELGSSAQCVPVDVTDADATSHAIESVLERFGRIDVNVNAAGIAPAGVITDGTTPLPLADFRRVIEVNLIGVFDVMRHCVTAMTANEPVDGERGVVVNVSSGAWDQGQRGQVAYAASKAAVVGVTLPAARDLARYGVRVVAIAPGLFDTAMASGISDKVRSGLEQMILHPKRLGDPDEFAAMAEHIVENRYLNATTIGLDAGVRMT